MKIAKILDCKIFEISKEEANLLLEKKIYQEQDKQRFILKEKDCFVAIDSTSGDCFVEDFKTLSGAYIWLSGLAEIEPLIAVEQLKEWY